jgi:hypothetical protein
MGGKEHGNTSNRNRKLVRQLVLTSIITGKALPHKAHCLQYAKRIVSNTQKGSERGAFASSEEKNDGKVFQTGKPR